MFTVMNDFRLIADDKFNLHPTEFAPYLLGGIIRVENLSGRIVETEAYTAPPEDYASHAYTREESAGPIMRTAGTVYIYSIHNGLAVNITCDPVHTGAVLLRAIEPLDGIREMIRHRSRRNTKISRTWDAEQYHTLTAMTNGPSKLAEALGIRKSWNNEPVGKHIRLFAREETPEIVTSGRIGISQSTELQWRYMDAESDFLSR